ncbi:hypothetical protein AN964_17895 [Heyndrickxia shackletonii]|uniref:ABC transmembrane type-1 domain-containing protein n=1 Tax=Heyndrickxia shackletonii TaxID=157838 RepID=A0A0Q3X081_9BACI|nr:hypothetical protein [Heyndrickxia shackletonii]KQL55199.1 hypothetical protein AN964_17895 [Heyndrickxia shackletonii]NEY98719.1 hypothetical protein [Heyndrickxia shackletonii]
MRKVPLLWIGIIGCSIIAFVFIFGPHLPKIDSQLAPKSYILGKGGNLDFILPPYPPSGRYLLGSDAAGRDMYSALILGTRTTIIEIGVISIITILLALPFGILSAHIPILRRILEGWNYLFSRIPVFFFVVLLTTIPFFIFSQQRPIWTISVIILLEVGKAAEFVHKSVKEIQQTAYYDAGIVSGTRTFGLWRWYYVPGCFSQWLSYFILHMGNMLFLLGQLGFFNIFVAQKLTQIGGIPGTHIAFYKIENTSIAWPTFLSNTFNDINNCPWVPIFACIFITFTIFSFIALGKGIMQYSLLKQKGLISRRENLLLKNLFLMNSFFKQEKEWSK